MKENAVLSIAASKPVYVAMAINLARSFKRWHGGSPIEFIIATDQKHLIPSDLSDITILELQPGQYGYGFSPKLHLDKITPAKRTLFVDADCLCVGSLEPVFDRFTGHAVSVVGGTISEGEWFGDVAAVCQKFEVAALPKFNGGIYYLEKGEMSARVYATARELESQYDAIGLTRLRGRPNDEVLMAIAMALYKQTPIPDDGSIMSDPQACPGKLMIDVLNGKSQLTNPPAPHIKHQNWYPFDQVSPTLVHFLGHYTTTHVYRREALRLELVIANNWSIWAANVWTALFCSLPFLSRKMLRDALRPAYRYFFGNRAVSVSERM